MEKLANSNIARGLVILLIIIGNILFYTLGGLHDSGAAYAWRVHWLFWLMWQSIFLFAIVGLIIMWIKKW